MKKIYSFAQAKILMAELIESYQPSPKIVRIEIRIKSMDMLQWLSHQKADVKIYGANQSDTTSIAGIGEAVSLQGQKIKSYQGIFKKLRSYLSVEHPYLQWYGGFCFDDRFLDGDWKDFGAYRFVIPRFELAANQGKMIFCCNLIGKENIKLILKQLQSLSDKLSKSSKALTVVRRADYPSQKLWSLQVKEVLKKKDLFKVVLARKTLLSFKKLSDPWTMLAQLKAVTPQSYHFAFQFGKTVFLGASPERLYRRYQRGIESEALAGTLPKSVKAEMLRISSKNQYEHAFVVRAIEEGFKFLTSAYQYDPSPEVLTLANGHHLITKFKGQLKDGIQDEDILKCLHPTPALGGSPRLKALNFIRQNEPFARGWYGAPLGYVGLDWAEFVVGIRSGLVKGKTLSVFAGAGIVNGSEALDEWNEVENKISNFMKIIL